MTLDIDSACSVRLRPASGDRAASYNLDILGASLWFPFDAVPSGVQDGIYKGASIEVVPRSVSSGSGSVARTLFAPVRVISLRK